MEKCRRGISPLSGPGETDVSTSPSLFVSWPESAEPAPLVAFGDSTKGVKEGSALQSLCHLRVKWQH